MIVQMMAGIAENDLSVQEIIKTAKDCGLNPLAETKTGGQTSVTIVYLKDGSAKASTIAEHVFEQLPGVEHVERVTRSDAKFEVVGDHYLRLKLGTSTIGQGLPCKLIAGPCTVDKYIDDLVDKLVHEYNIKLIRGGCWKPRSSPDSFPGYGAKAVEWLLASALKHGAEAVFIEVMDITHLQEIQRIHKKVGYLGTIVLWIGARTKNLALFTALGRQNDYPIMIKNPIDAKSVDEFGGVAKYILAGENEWDDDGNLIDQQSLKQGNNNIMLCCRGVNEVNSKPFRCNPNHYWINLARKYWAPVGFDGSHSAGTMINDLVFKNIYAGLVYMPDFCITEVYQNFNQGDRQHPLADDGQAVQLKRLSELINVIELHNKRNFRSEVY